MFLSGFYEQDIPIVTEVAKKYGLELRKVLVDKDWAAIKLVKTN